MTDQEAVRQARIARYGEPSALFQEAYEACDGDRSAMFDWFEARVAALEEERDEWKSEAYRLADVLPDGKP